MGFGALEIFLLKATQEAPASALVIKIESVVGSISLRINLEQLQSNLDSKLVPSHLILVMNFPHLCHTSPVSPVSPHLCHLDVQPDCEEGELANRHRTAMDAPESF